MNKTEHLLVCLIEECNEIAQDVCKILRFGLDDTNPLTNESNRKKLRKELADLEGVIQLLNENTDIDFSMLQDDINNKKDKVKWYMNYAIERGTLNVNNKETDSI